MGKYLDAVMALEGILSENAMEVLNDALQCYGWHPEEYSYPEELEDIRKLAWAFDWRGFNTVKPEFDILTGWEPPEDV